MNTIKRLLAVGSLVFSCLIVFGFNANAQLLVNEIESDPPSTIVTDRCQYVELRGTPGAAIAANTYFISINSDTGNPGFLNAAVNIGGQNLGSNGTITLFNTVGGDCPNRTYNAGTNFVNYFAGLTLGQTSEGFYVVTSATTLFAGQDLDTNDDGVLDVAVTFIDGFNYIDNREEEYKYGPGPILNTNNLGDVPDAASRCPGNNTPNSAAAFFFGELSTAQEESLVFVAPFSANFPTGAVLTPGAANSACAAVSGRTKFDFDGDGRADVSVFRGSVGNWFVNGSTSGFTAFNFGVSTDQIVPEDYDGDGRTDYAVFRPSNSTWYINGSTTGFRAIQFGLSTDITVPADYDGDGRADVAVFRPSNGTWYYQGSTAGFRAIQFGVSTDKPVAGDYDGDGRADVAVFRPSNSTWYIQGSTTGFRALPFGLSTDKLVPADYDGDGKTDIAVFRESNSTWYVQGSTAGFSALQFGATNDLAVPADYDGDGRTDIAVFRPSNGTWYYQGSMVGFRAVQFGVSTDRAIPNTYVR